VRIHRIGLVAGLLLAAQLAGTGCILIPKIEKRNVRLVVSRIATVPLHATGATNTISAASTVNLRDSIDLAAAVSDAGIDAAQLDSVVIGKVEYRVVSKDATAGRAIDHANIQVRAGRTTGAYTDLILDFSHPADAVTPWTRAPLASAGVTELNQMLAAILAEIKTGTPANENLGYTLTGASAPTTTATDFWYEIRLTILMSGRIKTDVLN
jgi:hypothetical protein